MLKFARFEITSAVLVSKDMSRTAARQVTAHRAVFEYEPRPGYLYVRSRAISSRCNDNFDEFPAEEIEKAYRTFVGKPVFVNHHNDNHRLARGVIIDAALHKDVNPDGTPDTWAEVLMEVDAVRFPLLAKAILAGEIDRTSMGTDVAYSICSACGNKASSPAEYCAHIPRMKGKRIYQVTGATGQKEGVLVRERCYGLGFFENSLLVEEPADPTAFFLGVDDRGLKMNASLATDLLREDVQAMEASKEYPRLDGVGLKQDDDGYYVQTHRARSDSYPSPEAIPDKDVEFIRSTGGLDVEAFFAQAAPLLPQNQCKHDGEWNLHGQCKQCGYTPSNEGDAECDHQYCQSTGFADGWHTNAEHIDPPHLDPGHPDYQSAEKAVNDAFGGEDHSWLLDHQEHGPTHLSSLEVEARDKVVFTPEQRASRREQGNAWNRKNPVRIKHVVDHWHQATDDEKANGMSWYEDAHHLAKHIANDTDTPMHTMAGLMTNYSPQTHWAQNIHTAAKVARLKTGLGGPGGGTMATTRQKDAADRMLSGEHYEDVFKSGAPKVRAFGHLIEHGGNHPDVKEKKVVIDRHALSVAAGARCTDVGYEQSKLGNKGRYEEVSSVYRKAAKAISKHEGREVEPHQVQATTWLVRQRLNEAHDRDLSKTAGSRSASLAKRAIGEWNKYAAEHHPAVMGKEPGTGYSSSLPDDVKHAKDMHEEGKTMTKASGWVPTPEDRMDFTDHLQTVAYGETKAPADVDTLRDEECPVCGETDSYDGNACQVCGFDAPPAMFQDPNLDMAKALDLRKDIAQDAGTLPGAAMDGMTPGEQDANAGVPSEVPGETTPGSDQVPVPVDPSQVDADGNVTPTTDPGQVLQQQMDLLQSGQPITPDMIGPNGEVVGVEQGLDPEAATGHFDQGGEPFTPGPNAPGEPGEPEGPVSPDDLDENGEQQAPDGQQEVPEQGEGDPGTPEDGVADLQCPACGFTADAAQPQSVDMDTQALPDAGTGTMAGDVCPNCQQAQMLSVGEMEQMAGAPPRV